jgi:hypothetical protein
MSRQEVLRVNHSVFVAYVFPQKPLPKTLTFKDEGKMRELAWRSETSAQPTSPQTGFEEQDLPRQMRQDIGRWSLRMHLASHTTCPGQRV